MKVILISLAAVLVAGVVFFFLKGDSYPTPKNTTIVAFGDSLVAGAGATQGNDFVSLVSKKIGKPIINMGVSGDTTAQGLARLDDVLAEDPGIVLLLLGGNDFLQSVPQAETEKNLRAIIEKLQANGVVVVLLGVRGGLLTDINADMFERLADEYDLPYVSDVLGGLYGKNEYMSDTVHPNDKGYAKIADRVAPVLKDVVK